MTNKFTEHIERLRRNVNVSPHVEKGDKWRDLACDTIYFTAQTPTGAAYLECLSDNTKFIIGEEAAPDVLISHHLKADIFGDYEFGGLLNVFQGENSIRLSPQKHEDALLGVSGSFEKSFLEQMAHTVNGVFVRDFFHQIDEPFLMASASVMNHLAGIMVADRIGDEMCEEKNNPILSDLYLKCENTLLHNYISRAFGMRYHNLNAPKSHRAYDEIVRFFGSEYFEDVKSIERQVSEKFIERLENHMKKGGFQGKHYYALRHAALARQRG